MSGCDKKRNSSLKTSLGYSPSKKTFIKKLCFASGFRFFPGAIAHKNNRPVNTRPEAMDLDCSSWFYGHKRPETGIKKGRGGEKKGSSCPLDYSVRPSTTPFLLTKNMEVFLASFPQHRPTFLKANLNFRRSSPNPASRRPI